MAHRRGDDDAGAWHFPAHPDRAALQAAYDLMALSRASSGDRPRLRPLGGQTAAPAGSPLPAGPARVPLAAARRGALSVPPNTPADDDKPASPSWDDTRKVFRPHKLEERKPALSLRLDRQRQKRALVADNSDETGRKRRTWPLAAPRRGPNNTPDVPGATSVPAAAGPGGLRRGPGPSPHQEEPSADVAKARRRFPAGEYLRALFDFVSANREAEGERSRAPPPVSPESLPNGVSVANGTPVPAGQDKSARPRVLPTRPAQDDAPDASGIPQLADQGEQKRRPLPSVRPGPSNARITDKPGQASSGNEKSPSSARSNNSRSPTDRPSGIKKQGKTSPVNRAAIARAGSSLSPPTVSSPSAADDPAAEPKKKSRSQGEWEAALRWIKAGNTRPVPCTCCQRRELAMKAPGAKEEKGDIFLPCTDRPPNEPGRSKGRDNLPPCARCKALHDNCRAPAGKGG